MNDSSSNWDKNTLMGRCMLALKYSILPDEGMNTPEENLTQLGYILPPLSPAAGNYLPFRREGSLLVLSGVLCVRDGVITHAGLVGDEQTVESAYEAAQICALNALATIKAALGSLSKVREFLQVTGYVAAVPRFGESPQVINGASDLFARVFGESGKHARAAVAVTGLPKNATVEIAVTVSIREED